MKTKTPNPKVSLTFKVKWRGSLKPDDSRTVLLHRPGLVDCFGFWPGEATTGWRDVDGYPLTGVTHWADLPPESSML